MSSDNTNQEYNIFVRSDDLNLIGKYKVTEQVGANGHFIIFENKKNRSTRRHNIDFKIAIKDVVYSIIKGLFQIARPLDDAKDDAKTYAQSTEDFVEHFDLYKKFKEAYLIPTDAIMYDINGYGLEGKYTVTKDQIYDEDIFIFRRDEPFQLKAINKKNLISDIESNKIQFTPPTDKTKFIKQFNLGSRFSRAFNKVGNMFSGKNAGSRYTGSKSKKNLTKKSKTKKNDKRR